MKVVAQALLLAEATRAKNAKVTALANALIDVAEREPERIAFTARLLTGNLLPPFDDQVLGVGGSLVFEAACVVCATAPAELGARARRAGDLGTAVGEAFAARVEGATLNAEPSLMLATVEELALTLATSGSRTDKLRALTSVLARATGTEARYIVRALLGEMRVGAREGIVEEAIGKAFGRALADVRRAGAVLADTGELARLAFEDRLSEARVTLGRPIGFMLATPIETARGADLTELHAVEDKIDGIRAQAHIASDGSVRLFARGKGSVTVAFPDITTPIGEAARRGDVTAAILDGEIVVVSPDGRPRPFSAIQPRLKKLAPDDALIRDYPVEYLVYDIMLERDEALLTPPFLERRARLVAWARSAPGPLRVHESRAFIVGPAPDDEAASPTNTRERASLALDAEFDGARGRGHEGLVLKRLDAVYAAGVRGFAWLKVKKALATLDVVIVGAERGHGKRAGVLSDYTFSVRDGDELRTIGKAFSGLTDAEIATMTARLEQLATAEEKHGFIPVRPEIVLEVAFDGLQRSERHSSGFALRFPRIARIRDDKQPADADTLDAVRALWEAQLASGHREEAKPAQKRGRRSGRRHDVRAKSKQLNLFDDEDL